MRRTNHAWMLDDRKHGERGNKERTGLKCVPGEKEDVIRSPLSSVAILDRRGSVTGLYKQVEGRGIVAIDNLDKHGEDVLVSCGRKLTSEEKAALAEKGLTEKKVLSVMEISIWADLHVMREKTQGRHTEHEGCIVINYLVLNKNQAERLVQDTDVKVIERETHNSRSRAEKDFGSAAPDVGVGHILYAMAYGGA